MVTRRPPVGLNPRAAGVLAAAACLAAFGCTSDREAPTAIVRDSAGITIVENPVEAPERWTLPAEPALEVGVVEGEEAYQLSGVVGAVWSARDELVVANGDTDELRFYDASGRHLRTVGGEGEGPGEFSALYSLHRRGDSLVAHDARKWRFSIFGSDGELIDMTAAGDLYIGLLGDGSLVSYAFPRGEEPSRGSYMRTEGRLVRHAGEASDTIARWAMDEAWLDPELPGRSEPVFARGTRIRVTGDRILIADNESYEIRVLGPDDDVRRLIRRRGAVRSLSEEDHRRFIQARAEAFADDPRAEFFLRTFRSQPVRETMPAFGRSGLVDDRLPWLLVDPDGRIWVLDYLAFPEETPTWSVYDPDGRLVGELRTPVGLALLYAGEDRVVGLRRDELGVDHVAVYDLPASMRGAGP